MPPTRLARPWWLLSLPVGFNLWVLRAEARSAESLNDGSLHEAMIRTAARTFSHGRIPLDVWFPFLSTGSANFHQYQSLPHIVTGLFGALAGGDRAFTWSTYLLLALWPVAVYAGARLLDWDSRSALGAAFVASLVASFPGYGFEWLSYTYAGLGVWSQLWGMWLLPIALGFTWRAVDRNEYAVPAAVALSVTIVAHVITGYFAALALVVWAVVRPSASRVIRGAAVGAAAIAAGLWLMVPILADRKWVAGGAFLQGVYRNSFGARRVLVWFFTGRLVDQAFMPAGLRFPAITVLAYAGLAWCVIKFRDDVRARALIGLLVLALVMFSGRPTFGFVLDRLPGSSSLLFHRYVSAVQMASILFAGVGAGWLAGLISRALRTRPALAGAIAVLVGVVVLAPAWRERASYAAISARLIDRQRRAERADGGARAGLIALAAKRDDGRIYAGRPSDWGREYTVGVVPGYASILNHDGDGIGYTFRVGSMVTDAEPFVDERNAAQLDAFGVRYLLMPDTRMPQVPAREIARRGRHVLWETQGSGYVAVVDTIAPITIRDQLHAGAVQTGFLNSADLARGLYPTVAYLGSPGARPTADASRPPAGRPGAVTHARYAPTRGVFEVDVTAARTAAVMLKSSYHARWRVTVDGRVARKYMVAPGYPAVTVAAGAHTVEFRYVAIGYYPWLFLLGIAALAALFVGTRRVRSRTQKGKLPDDLGDRPVLLAQARPLHADEKEQQQEADVEGEVDAPPDAEVVRDDRGHVRDEHGDDQTGD
jgi:hypothetical protein